MKICVATGTRAEYGLLKPLIDEIQKNKSWDLQILVTGAHLSPEFGLTYQVIEQDGLKIASKVEMLLSSDSAEGIVKSMGLGMIGYSDTLKNLQPDLLLILGDRYEMLALAATALIFRVPIAHIHGGEITEGAYDDAIRHSITKMSHIHFTSTEDYRKRVIQLGENPENVHNVGALGLDNVINMNLLTRTELEHDLNIKLKKYNYQITFHPATLEEASTESQFRELLKAIDTQEDSFFIFSKANADTDGRIINQMIDEFVKKNSHKAVAYSSLGTKRFLSVLKACDAIIGNSSSGILEAPSIGIATINIGDRQKGRIQAKSIINTVAERNSIISTFEKVKYSKFNDSVKNVTSPYGNGNAAVKIAEILKRINTNSFRTKPFFDLIDI